MNNPCSVCKRRRSDAVTKQVGFDRLDEIASLNRPIDRCQTTPDRRVDAVTDIFPGTRGAIC